MAKNIVFSDVNFHHKRLEALTKYLLEHNTNASTHTIAEIKAASEYLNTKIVELYKRGPFGI